MHVSWRALSVGLGLAAFAATVPAVAQDDDESADTIVVIGTRVANRSALDTAVPVDVVPLDDITQTGFTELNQALSYALPSFNFPLPSITDGTDHVRPATLRGLGPDQTLVLVNSKRRHASPLVNINGSVGRGSSAVDLNMIPTAAVRNVQVLRDGASAQYGSDAIAGVIDVQLKEASEGGGASLSYGQYVTSPGALDRDINDGDTLTVSGWAGLPLGADGFLTISGEFRDREPTNRAGLDPRQQYPEVSPGVADPREATFDRLNHRFGNADVQDLSLFVNAGLPLDNGHQLYGMASYGARDGESAGFYRRALDSRNVPEIYPDGFLPLITTDITDYSLGGGVRGEVAGWSYDASVTHGADELDYGVEHSLNTTLGPTSQTSFDAGGLKYSQTTANLDFVQGFDVGDLASPLNVAAGLEYRRETYEISAGEEASYVQGPFPGAAGSQVFPGFQPSNEIDEDRDSIGVYVDLEANVTERFLLSGAVRAESYSDFGETVTGKVAARFDVTDDFALRGAVSTGFRAPSLQQSFFTATSTNFINGVPFEVGTFPASSDVAAALGGKPLDAEESVNYSAGIVWTAGDFTLTVDAYRIDIDDRIVLSENLTGTDVVNLLTSHGINNVNSARFFINGVDTETQGVDIVASYAVDFGEWGDVDFTAGLNFTDTDVTRTPQLEPLPGLTIFGRREIARFEVGQPDSKATLAADWSRGRWGATARATRFGETISPGTTAASDVTLGPKTIIDLEGRFDINDRVQLAVGANNVFDEYPDETPDGLNFNGIFPYSGFSPFGFNGRYVYGRVSVNF